jgi:solute carrier family 45, member 1/2/4
MVAGAGISWALTLWAPFALIAQCVSHINDVSRRESIASSRSLTPDLRAVDASPAHGVGSPVLSGISVSNPDERRPSVSTAIISPQPQFASPAKPEKKEEITSAGTIMGLHNVFISSPQFISTLLASVIFHFLGAGGRGDDIGPTVNETRGGGSIAWVLRIGGLGGIIAAYLTWCLAEEKEVFPDEAVDI